MDGTSAGPSACFGIVGKASRTGKASKASKARIRLTQQQRQDLEHLTRNGISSAKRILHARVLLMADEEHPLGRYTDEKIGQTLGVHVKTVSRIRQAFLHGGITLAVERKVRSTPPILPKLDGKAEATLVAICCSPPPQGRAHWSMQLLAEELVKRQVVVSICKETVRQRLKKTSYSRGG